jgi:hypothetical protein
LTEKKTISDTNQRKYSKLSVLHQKIISKNSHSFKSKIYSFRRYFSPLELHHHPGGVLAMGPGLGDATIGKIWRLHGQGIKLFMCSIHVCCYLNNNKHATEQLARKKESQKKKQ